MTLNVRRPRGHRLDLLAPLTLLALGALAVGCTSTESDAEPPLVIGGDGDMGALDGATPEPEADAEVDAAMEPDMMLADPPVEPICTAGTIYGAATPLFAERTVEWKLEQLAVHGTRMSVGDIDGDGWADVMVRRGGRRADILVEDPEVRRRHHWMLRNDRNAFVDVTEESGFLATRGAYPVSVGRPIEVVAFADVDNDGDLDAYSGLDVREAVSLTVNEEEFAVRERSELLINDGAGVFTLAAEDHPLRRDGLVDVPSGAAFVDYDLDGNIDLWMSQGGLGAPLQDRLYAGDGAGSFADRTAEAGLTTAEWERIDLMNAGEAHTTAWSAAACDLNDDGYPELLAASYGRAPNHLWQARPGDGGVSFENRSVASGYAYDEDLDWTSNQFARCYCAANRGDAGCADAPAPNIQCGQQNWRHQFDREPFRLGGNSGATVCVDLDNDGALDLYTTEIKHWWAGGGSDGGEPLLNAGEPDVRLTRPGREESGTDIPHPQFNWDEGHITAGYIDVDNDGRQDIYVGATDYAGNRGRLYVNTSSPGTIRFVEAPIEDFFEHNRSHGMAVADFDRDGDLDMLVGHSRSRCDANAPNNCYPTMQVRFFENILGQDGNWLQLDLVGGPGSNRAAIGARVTVRTEEGLQVQEVGGGYGHFGAQRDRILHFGLGTACEATVTVRWPDASLTTETLRLGSGYRYRWAQGQPIEVLER